MVHMRNMLFCHAGRFSFQTAKKHRKTRFKKNGTAFA